MNKRITAAHSGSNDEIVKIRLRVESYVLDPRVGAKEREAIKVLSAYLDAKREYTSRDGWATACRNTRSLRR
ncbi:MULTISPECIES: DUF2950 family protein [Caballeronia]|jgi:hypothetical protein|uniref:DUF2950 family protein n=1 Tax=Caballeronia TaxID=1827195 RepID=UPI0007726910|nr:DUF2950 family protein [Caballeronia sp. INML1]